MKGLVRRWVKWLVVKVYGEGMWEEWKVEEGRRRQGEEVRRNVMSEMAAVVKIVGEIEARAKAAGGKRG